MASPGSGSSNHLTLERLNAMAGTKIVHIPYKGTGPAINDVVGGQVDLTFASGSASKALLDGGKVKAIAVTSSTRNPLLPQVPTIAESGLVGFESIAGQGLFAPAGTPRDIVTQAQRRGQRDHQDARRCRSSGRRWASTASRNTPEQFAAWLAKESDKWAAIIRAE